MISKATLKAIDPIVRKVSNGSLYTSYQLTEQEFVGSVPYAVPGIAWYLPEKTAYETPPKKLGISVQAVKTHPNREQMHDAAYRKVADSHPEIAQGTALTDFEPEQCQYHVHIFDDLGESPMDSQYNVFSHYELRPDLERLAGESIGDMITRLKTHLSPTWDKPENDFSEWSYLRGVMDPALEGVIE